MRILNILVSPSDMLIAIRVQHCTLQFRTKTMAKSTQTIPTFNLDTIYRAVHKERSVESHFGMDSTDTLLDGSFGLYSSEGVRARIGPLKSQFYRVALCLRGEVDVECGLERFRHSTGTMHFNFPGQLFSLQNKSDDMFAYYALFTQEFVEEVLPATKIQLLYPFLDYAGIPFFQLSEEEAQEIAEIFLAINDELRRNFPDRNRAIKLLLAMLLLKAKRSYIRQELTMLYHNPKASSLVVRFKKLVAQHFLTIRSVSDYASKLAVSPKHLSKIIKHETDKNPSDFIDEMLLLEVQCMLRYTDLSVAEISYQLEFADPSHLTKFFKKHTSTTPMQYRMAAQE
jgi:AraC family transcriptional regulator, transcriptional activator of pobA